MVPEVSTAKSVARALLWFRGRLRRGSVAQVQRQLPLRPAEAVVCPDDPLHEVMTHHVAVFEMAETDAVHTAQNLDGLHQPALFGIRQINLGYIASDYSLGIAAKAGKEHLHLF